jgi:hypothetical protein
MSEEESVQKRRQSLELTRKALRTPRAAAAAGIVFAVLFATSIVLIRIAIPEDLRETRIALSAQGREELVATALNLVPFSGIAFLWFMGVVRDRLGKLEDQFFSTVFFGSGLLFIGMMFISAAVAGGILRAASLLQGTQLGDDVLTFARATMFTTTNVYATRMAGVFMLSLGTIWIRTRVMPRLFVFLTYGLALVMLVSVNVSLWLILIFPAWVLVISIYILVVSMRGDTLAAEEVTGSPSNPAG